MIRNVSFNLCQYAIQWLYLQLTEAMPAPLATQLQGPLGRTGSIVLVSTHWRQYVILLTCGIASQSAARTVTFKALPSRPNKAKKSVGIMC